MPAAPHGRPRRSWRKERIKLAVELWDVLRACVSPLQSDNEIFELVAGIVFGGNVTPKDAGLLYDPPQPPSDRKLLDMESFKRRLRRARDKAAYEADDLGDGVSRPKGAPSWPPGNMFIRSGSAMRIMPFSGGADFIGLRQAVRAFLFPEPEVGFNYWRDQVQHPLLEPAFDQLKEVPSLTARFRLLGDLIRKSL